MRVYRVGNLQVCFGDRASSISLDAIPMLKETGARVDRPPFALFNDHMPFTSLFFTDQVHKTDGIEVTPSLVQSSASFAHSTDFLMTDYPHIALGILTADCVPMVLYDDRNNAVSIVHAGWRGSVAGIAVKALEAMMQRYKTRPEDIKVIFGPAARSCCYEIQSDVQEHITAFAWGDSALRYYDGRIFADMVDFNRLSLQEAGVPWQAMVTHLAECTICDTSLCSHRRQPESARRQISMAVLNYN